MKLLAKLPALLTLVAICSVASHLEAQNPSIDELLDRATVYVDDFFDRFANVVAEEHYVQEVESPSLVEPKTGTVAQMRKTKRDLRSDFLLVTFPGLQGRMSFRDVFEVDGRAVRDKAQDGRLVALFGNAAHDVVQRAREISETSARYNLVGVETDPFVAMGYLQAVFRPRFRFRGGDEKDDLGPDVRMVRFDERQRPTVLRTPTDGDLPSRGRIWLDKTTGRVVKTELMFSLGRHRREVLTSYRWDDDLQMDVLGEVRDAYSAPYARTPKVATTSTFRGVATYSHFRRFQVRTEQTIR